MYRAAFLCMFQGGMGVNELVYWSENGYANLMEQLNNNSRVIRIDLAGRKAQRNKRPYHTYIGNDAIKVLREYLKIRPKTEAKSIFLSQRVLALKDAEIRWYWNKRIERLGLTNNRKGSGSGVRYGKNPHELRDLFRTRWERSGVKGLAAEYFMGHVVDPLDYNKAYRDEEYTRALYLEAEPWLNLLSEEPEKVSRTEHEKHLREIKEVQDKRIAELEAQQAITDRQLEALMESLREREKLEDLEKEAK
jgi:hypothetical protein